MKTFEKIIFIVFFGLLLFTSGNLINFLIQTGFNF
jgi:hypothetical protein